MSKYMCIAKCPELDYDNEKHCEVIINGEEELLELKDKQCPCGNNPIWNECISYEEIINEIFKGLAQIGGRELF